MKIIRNVRQARFSYSIAIAALLFLVGSRTITGQDCEKTRVQRDWFSSAAEKAQQGWQKIELPGLVLFLPKDFVRRETKCIDPGCARFATENSRIVIDDSQAASFPTAREMNNPAFCGEYYGDGDSRIWIWHSFDPDDATMPFTSGVLFNFDDPKKRRVGIYFFSRKKYDRDLARGIFRSVILK